MNQKERTALTREKIMDAAMREFGANGYSSASTNNICAAGLSKGLLYHNFKGKDDLYLLCVKRCMDDFTAYLKAQQVRPDMKAYLAARLNYFKEHKLEAHLFFEAVLDPPAALRAEIAGLRTEFDAYNQAFYLSILAGLRLRPEVSRQDALTYFSLLQSMFNGYFSSPACQEVPFEERVSAHEENLLKLLEYMLYGIAERGAEK